MTLLVAMLFPKGMPPQVIRNNISAVSISALILERIPRAPMHIRNPLRIRFRLLEICSTRNEIPNAFNHVCRN